MKLNYHLLENSVILNFDGKTVSLHSGDERFNKVIQAIKDDDFEAIRDLLDNQKRFDAFGVEYRDGGLFLDDIRLPSIIENKVLLFMEKELPYEPLIKFTRKMRLNPSFNSRKMLYDFLEHNGHPITMDGNFIAYRGCSEDFKDRHTGTFNNSVGSVCEMPRHEVDENPNNTCSAGLHVACYEYAYNWGSKTIEVEIDPQDVVAVPTDYEGTKMRVCKFKVVNICEAIQDDGLYGYDEMPALPELHEEFKVGENVKVIEGGTFIDSRTYEEMELYGGEIVEIMEINANMVRIEDDLGQTCYVDIEDIKR